MKASEQLENHLEGILVSYVLSQDDIEKHLKELKFYLTRRGFKIEHEKLKDGVFDTKRAIEAKEKNNQLKALLFTKDDKLREYQFGSDFCPKCKMFKNYEKECPYCGHLELTRR